MTNLEAKQSLARKLNIDYSDIANNDLFSDADLQAYINAGAMQAWDFADWDFKEHAQTATLNATAITNGYIIFPEIFAPSSINLLKIGGKTFDKKSFKTFSTWFETYPADQSKYWAEFKRKIFFNANACSVGDAIDAYASRSMVALSADGDLLPFSPDEDNSEYSGNEAIVRLAYAEALSSDKKKNTAQAELERKNAFQMLSLLAQSFQSGRSSEQDKNRPMFSVPDFFRGGTSRGDNNIGTFNI